jgi:type IV pilus biogenesis protein CpaD/CtpE
MAWPPDRCVSVWDSRETGFALLSHQANTIGGSKPSIQPVVISMGYETRAEISRNDVRLESSIIAADASVSRYSRARAAALAIVAPGGSAHNGEPSIVAGDSRNMKQVACDMFC